MYAWNQFFLAAPANTNKDFFCQLLLIELSSNQFKSESSVLWYSQFIPPFDSPRSKDTSTWKHEKCRHSANCMFPSSSRPYSRSHLLVSLVLMQEILGNYSQLYWHKFQLCINSSPSFKMTCHCKFSNSPLSLFTHITFSRVRLLTRWSILLSIESHCNCLNVIYVCVSCLGLLIDSVTHQNPFSVRQKPMTNCTSYRGKNQAKTLNVRAIKTSL